MANRTFTRSEIGKILKTASQIEAENNATEEIHGISEDELLALANELGVSRNAIEQALHQFDKSDHTGLLKKLAGASKLQDVVFFDDTIHESNWTDIVQYLHIEFGTSGTSKESSQGFEWENTENEIERTYLSFSNQKGKTKLQYLANWSTLRAISLLLSIFFGGILTLIMLKGLGLPKAKAILSAPIGSLLGFTGAVFYLNYKWGKEKKRFNRIKKRISELLTDSTQQRINLEESELYQSSESGKTDTTPSTRYDER